MPDTRVLDQFGEFCLLKKSVQGPDVHMKLAGTGTEDAGHERPWRLAVYNNFASTPVAGAVWSRWGDPEDVMFDYLGFEEWVRKNWAGLPIRQNRRPARSVPKLSRSLTSLAEWMTKPDGYALLGEQSYDEAWKSLDFVFTWGRYVKIKFLETARLFLGHEHLVAPSIMAAGGWSPRRALALIYPEYEATIANKARNDKRTLSHVYSVADEVRAYVSENWVPVSNYELEALLCNYRQTLSTRKAFYVGRTIDSELEIDRKIRGYWGEDPYLGTFDFFKSRLKTFPSHTLGEYQGWDTVRKDLSTVLTEHGYIWADTVYSYRASKEDLATPVRWTP